ncbi:hypothetical protein [Natrinema sp. DC36]|uniref:hypothetical protein n=1 Tax=Natrinema sp. DC36 TaxID=2878680 RepID=UPI001CF00E29|nr:hypothetical protein [Natrinema sp. DC36]
MEYVETEPENVFYGEVHREQVMPLVIFEFNKHNAFLPPWDKMVSFTLEGDETATFGNPELRETKVTGEFKTVHIFSPVVKFNV